MADPKQTAYTPWAIPVANVFRVIAPEAPHRNVKEGSCPPYPWAIVADMCPESVGGEQAAEWAKLIVRAVNSHDKLVEALEAIHKLSQQYFLSSRAAEKSQWVDKIRVKAEAALRAAKGE